MSRGGFGILNCCRIDIIILNRIQRKKFMNFLKEKIYYIILCWLNITGIIKKMEKLSAPILMQPEKNVRHFLRDCWTASGFRWKSCILILKIPQPCLTSEKKNAEIIIS